MLFHYTPIERKLMLVNLLTSGVVLFVTCIAFFAYEYHIFRKSTVTKLTSIGEITAANSTAALAFDDAKAATELLTALQAEEHIVAAVLYDSVGDPFAQYPANLFLGELPAGPPSFGYQLVDDYLIGNQPVILGTTQLGTLYLKSDLTAWDDRFELYRMVVLFVMVFSFFIAWALSRFLSKGISNPIIALSETATIISNQKDYSVRAEKQGNDEVGNLTDAFNLMLGQIQAQNNSLIIREEELKRNNKELEKVNADLDDFIYTASHDLKSPISNLEALIVVVKEEFENIASPTHLRFLEMMETSIMRMRKTILDLGEITKTQKNFDNEAEQVLFHRTIEDVKEDVMVGYKEADVVINEELNVPHIFYPAKGFRSIIYNLLSNAIKYRSAERPVEINIKTYRENESVILMVEDNGLGIEEHQLPKMFSMFQRFHTHVEGTGIGLYIIKRIVENRGGRIQYISKGDQGSIFKVFF